MSLISAYCSGCSVILAAENGKDIAASGTHTHTHTHERAYTLTECCLLKAWSNIQKTLNSHTQPNGIVSD